jgi:hypothetical protein
MYSERRSARRQTADGKKYNRVPEYTRGGSKNQIIMAREHGRSNPSTSKGKAKSTA